MAWFQSRFRMRSGEHRPDQEPERNAMPAPDAPAWTRPAGLILRSRHDGFPPACCLAGPTGGSGKEPEPPWRSIPGQHRHGADTPLPPVRRPFPRVRVSGHQAAPGPARRPSPFADSVVLPCQPTWCWLPVAGCCWLCHVRRHNCGQVLCLRCADRSPAGRNAASTGPRAPPATGPGRTDTPSRLSGSVQTTARITSRRSIRHCAASSGWDTGN